MIIDGKILIGDVEYYIDEEIASQDKELVKNIE